MTILYIVVYKNKEILNSKTKESIEEVMQPGDKIIFKETNENENYSLFKTNEPYDMVCVIPNEGVLNKNFRNIINDYYDNDRKIVFLPLVVLLLEKNKGILNTCLWNSNLIEEIGVLTYNLAMLQIDTTLYGSLVPYDLFFDEDNYHKDLKYYQHFYFLNKITAKENNLVFGIPKTLLYTNIDLSFSYISNEEKLQNFKMAKYELHEETIN